MLSADLGLLSPVWAGTRAAAMTGDEGFLGALLDIECAWVAAQAEVGLASEAEARSVAAAREGWEPDLASLAARGADGGNVLIPLLKDFRARVASVHGAPVAALHRGATSQDIIDTALVLLLVRAAEETLARLAGAADALAELALTHRDDVCIARSLTQHALPITIGHRLARWVLMLDDASDALGAALASAPVQWGGAVGTLASLVDALRAAGAGDAGAGASGGGASGGGASGGGASGGGASGAGAGADAGGAAEAAARDLVARLGARLGLAVPPTAWHTRRAPLLRLASALSEAIAAGGKIANDVLLLARPEVAELAEPQAPGKGGSSAMPHKRNPVLSVLLKEAALEAPGHLSTVYLAAGQAGDERPDGAWHAEWQALRSLARLAGGGAARLEELAVGLQVFPARSAQVAGLFGDVVLSERLAARLGPRLPGGSGRVGELVATSIDTGQPLRTLLRAELPAELLSDAELDDLLNPSNYLGLAPSEVEAIVAAHRQRKDPTP